MSTVSLKITFAGSYISKNGNDVFRYHVTGKPDALSAYEDAQGDNYRVDDEGNVLWFTTRFAGDTGTLVVNGDTGRIYADMSEFRKQASLAKQFGGNLGDQIAAAAVGKLFGKAIEPNQAANTPKQVSQSPSGIGGL